LLSILGFKDLTGILPKMVTVGGWGFKKDRFMEIAKIINWPLSKFSYVGINCPSDLARAETLEKESLARLKLTPTGVEPLLMEGRIWSGPLNVNLAF
jgi:hypothetical protein